jgi:hypothetical protein
LLSGTAAFLYDPAMLVIYEDTAEFLSLRTSRFQECLGLFFCGIGLLSISIAIIANFDKSVELTIHKAFLFQLAYYCALFAVAGLLLVFSQRKFLFYIPELKIICWEGMRQKSVISFSEIIAVDVRKGNENRGLLRLIRNGDTAVFLTRGNVQELYPIARRISKLLNVDITSSDGRT